MALSRQRIEQIATLTILGVIALGCLTVLRPFLAALTWALILSMSTWPTYRWFERKLHGRRTIAAAIMTLLVAIALLLPLVLVGSQLAEQVTSFSAWLSEQLTRGVPGPPPWVGDLPVVGDWLRDTWTQFSLDSGPLTSELRPYVGTISTGLLSVAARVGKDLLELTISVLTTFFFYRDGASAARRATMVLQRLSGGRALHFLSVAENTMTGVVYGIIGTCLVQGALAGFGFWVAGVPGAFLLGLASGAASLIPMGPPLIWLPSSIWLMRTDPYWGIALFFWGLLVVSTADNVIKPLFIHRGGTLPLLLVLLGIFGGVLSFGFLGIFIGPVLLAVGYSLIKEWAPDDTAAAGTAPLPPSGDDGGAAAGAATTQDAVPPADGS
jgi:predicted PurR-regulated permease PerM